MREKEYYAESYEQQIDSNNDNLYYSTLPFPTHGQREGEVIMQAREDNANQSSEAA
jgi:hypothetical protein